MCVRCYGNEHTEPLCDAPRFVSLSRNSGWLCGSCGHWHPYPTPLDPGYRR